MIYEFQKGNIFIQIFNLAHIILHIQKYTLNFHPP